MINGIDATMRDDDEIATKVGNIEVVWNAE